MLKHIALGSSQLICANGSDMAKLKKIEMSIEREQKYTFVTFASTMRECDHFLHVTE